MSFSPNYYAWTPNPAVNRTLRIKLRKAGYLEHCRGRFAPAMCNRGVSGN